MNEIVARTIEKLQKNRMEAYYVETAAEALEKIKELCPEGSLIASGGSATLAQIGALDLFRSGKYDYADRYAPNADMALEARRAFNADVYFLSANAITENGELYNVDGTGNRVAALTFGPKSIVVVAGVNKIVPDMAAAVERVENIAAPLNAQRLNKKTPCAATGKCHHCSSPDRICCVYHTAAQQREPGRIKVIIVNENLGF